MGAGFPTVMGGDSHRPRVTSRPLVWDCCVPALALISRVPGKPSVSVRPGQLLSIYRVGTENEVMVKLSVLRVMIQEPLYSLPVLRFLEGVSHAI